MLIMRIHEAAKFGFMSLLCIIFSGFFSKAYCQQANRISGSTGRDFQISVTNSFGVRTSIDANANVKARNDATVNLLPGSVIDDAFGDSNGDANANFTISPNGGNMGINGIQSRNTFLFGEGTQFNSTMESVDNPDPSLPVRGNASSMATHEFNVKVQSQDTAFSSSFSQSF